MVSCTSRCVLHCKPPNPAPLIHCAAAACPHLPSLVFLGDFSRGVASSCVTPPSCLPCVCEHQEAMRKAEEASEADCQVKIVLVAPPLYVLTTHTLSKVCNTTPCWAQPRGAAVTGSVATPSTWAPQYPHLDCSSFAVDLGPGQGHCGPGEGHPLGCNGSRAPQGEAAGQGGAPGSECNSPYHSLHAGAQRAWAPPPRHGIVGVSFLCAPWAVPQGLLKDSRKGATGVPKAYSCAWCR